MEKNFYRYRGPVFCFENCICRCWEGTTYAVSEKKAKSNLSFQFKMQNNYTSSAKITLPDQVIKES
jgi:hypothetical protein